MNIKKIDKPLRKTRLGKITQKIKNRTLYVRKKLYQKTHKFSKELKRNIFIFGCQRSGTTLLGQVFDRDLRSIVLQEESRLTQKTGEPLRLKSHADVVKILNGFRVPLIIAKPLVESHKADKILEDIPDSKGIWMFRDFNDVVASNIKRFSTQVEGLKMSITGKPPSYRSESNDTETKELLKRFYNKDMPAEDAAALGWYSINKLFFHLNLFKNKKVALFRYEDFVQSPEKMMRYLYKFIEFNYPDWNLVKEVDNKSISLGKHIEINPKIRALCKELNDKIIELYHQQLDQ